MHDLEHERRLVTREHQMLSDSESRMRIREEALRQREETIKKRLDEKLETRLRDARREIDKVVDDLKRRSAELAARAERRAPGPQHASISTGDVGRLAPRRGRLSIRRPNRCARQVEPPAASVPVADNLPRPVVGDRVVVAGLGLEGTWSPFTTRMSRWTRSASGCA